MFASWKRLTVATALTLAATAGWSSVALTAAQAESVRVLILAKDNRHQALPATAPVTEEIFDAMAEQFEQSGVDVFNVDDLRKGARHRATRPMNDKKLARFARNQLKPRHGDADVVLSLNIEAEKIRYRGQRFVELRAVGRIVDVNTGKRLYRVNIDPNEIQPVRLRANCQNHACMKRALKKRADRIGSDIAEAMLDDPKLKRRVKRAARFDDMRDRVADDIRDAAADILSMKLSLVGFDRRTVMEILDLLPETDRGYLEHEIRHQSQFSRQVDYQTVSSRDEMRQHLVSMFVSLGIDARIANSRRGLTVSEIEDEEISWLDDQQDEDDEWGHADW